MRTFTCEKLKKMFSTRYILYCELRLEGKQGKSTLFAESTTCILGFCGLNNKPQIFKY